MPTYVIGDVQGCFEPLTQLLTYIHYDPNKDTLWFTGDIVNRGPQSLRTLRFVRSLPASTICVLGNHELALLAASIGAISPQPGDTYQEILSADDKEDLLTWIRHCPLMHYDPTLQFTISHAGIYPGWDRIEAKKLADEAEAILRGSHYVEALEIMFGNHPNRWSESLVAWDRFRFIINAFTRMRYCSKDGTLILGDQEPEEMIPWFKMSQRKTEQDNLVFGHWAALAGESHTPRVHALDTGCVWGKALSALCLETEKRFQIACSS